MVPVPDRSRTQLLITIGRRLVEGLLTAWAAVSLTFFSLRLAAGDPTYNLLSQGLATAQQAEELRQVLGLDAPLWLQYLRFLRDLMQGDLGLSLYTSRPVGTIIAEQFSFTIGLALAGLAFALLVGFTLGIAAAWWEPRLVGRSATFITNLSTSLPVAFTGILVLFLALHLSMLASLPGLNTGLILPAIVLGITSAGPIGRVVQASLKESLESPYILAAHARGLREDARMLWHAFRPALPPVISLTALEAAYLFSGTVVTETVFARPGLGRLLVKSILEGDYPIAQGLVVLAAIFYTFSQLSADLAAIMLDPRTRRSA